MNGDIKTKTLVPTGGDSIRIKRGRGKGRISATVLHFIFQDKDTSQFVIFVPSFDLTSYGETKEKALEMMHHTVTTYLSNLVKLPHKLFQEELAKYGWKQNKLKHKEYSKVFVDGDGELNGLENAIENIVEVGIISV